MAKFIRTARPKEEWERIYNMLDRVIDKNESLLSTMQQNGSDLSGHQDMVKGVEELKQIRSILMGTGNLNDLYSTLDNISWSSFKNGMKLLQEAYTSTTKPLFGGDKFYNTYRDRDVKVPYPREQADRKLHIQDLKDLGLLMDIADKHNADYLDNEDLQRTHYVDMHIPDVMRKQMYGKDMKLTPEILDALAKGDFGKEYGNSDLDRALIYLKSKQNPGLEREFDETQWDDQGYYEPDDWEDGVRRYELDDKGNKQYWEDNSEGQFGDPNSIGDRVNYDIDPDTGDKKYWYPDWQDNRVDLASTNKRSVIASIIEVANTFDELDLDDFATQMTKVAEALAEPPVMPEIPMQSEDVEINADNKDEIYEEALEMALLEGALPHWLVNSVAVTVLPIDTNPPSSPQQLIQMISSDADTLNRFISNFKVVPNWRDQIPQEYVQRAEDDLLNQFTDDYDEMDGIDYGDEELGF